jgi:DNA-binding FrmR family transcriptional regulator
MATVERALDNGSGCADVLQLLTFARGAMNGLMAEAIENHVQEHVASPARPSVAEHAKGIDELVEVILSNLK